MRADLREFLRHQIIRCLTTAKGNALPVDIIAPLCRTAAGRSSVEDVAAEIDYLVGKGLVEKASKLISPEIGAWKITAAGRDYAALEGLE